MSNYVLVSSSGTQSLSSWLNTYGRIDLWGARRVGSTTYNDPFKYYKYVSAGGQRGTFSFIVDNNANLTISASATNTAMPYIRLGSYSASSYGYNDINRAAIQRWNGATNTVTSNSANWNSTYDTVYNNSASWTGGGGGGVSGTNVVFVPDYEGAEEGNYWSASISGDIQVATGSYFYGGSELDERAVYSLSSIGNSIGSKLDKSTIDGSNTLINYAGHTEVGEKAYRATGFINGSAINVRINDGDADVDFDSDQIELGTHLYSAIVTVETTTTGDVPEKWNLISYENNSAILTKNFSVNTNSDSLSLMVPEGWNVTNCDASATVYSALEIAPLAFKDEIAFTDVSDIVVTASLPVSPVSSTLYLIPEA